MRNADGSPVVIYQPDEAEAAPRQLRTRVVIGADGANSAVARQEIPGPRPAYVFAYHEIIRAPRQSAPKYEATRCDIYYQGRLSPDFYAWVFPHGDTASVGVGSARKGFALRDAIRELRAETGLTDCETIRCEGAPIPLKPRKIWDNRRDVIVAGDAAGVVAPASGEGIYYAMESGRIVAECAGEFLQTGDSRRLAKARGRFLRRHGIVFWILGIMQYFWYANDRRRERFVAMCEDPDVQRLTWNSYMNKEVVFKDPFAHVKIFFKDLAHLLGSARAS